MWNQYYVLRKNELKSFEKVSKEERIPYDVVAETVFDGNEVTIIRIGFPEIGGNLVERWIDSFFEDLRKDNRKEIYKEAFVRLKPLFEEILSTENSGQSWWRPPDWNKGDGHYTCDMGYVEDFLKQFDEWLFAIDESDS